MTDTSFEPGDVVSVRGCGGQLMRVIDIGQNTKQLICTWVGANGACVALFAPEEVELGVLGEAFIGMQPGHLSCTLDLPRRPKRADHEAIKARYDSASTPSPRAEKSDV